MLGQRFAYPDILAVFGTNEQYKVVASGIVRVEQIRDYAQ
jgi:hypothetical protein